MINVLHLLWIIPSSMALGAATLICISMAIISKEADKELERMEKENYDN